MKPWESILVFGGTIEGRQVSDYLSSRRQYHLLCVATEYGEEVLTAGEYLDIRQGRLTQEQICSLLRTEGCQLVVDATHPYAVEVSRNIRSACQETGTPCLRYLRPAAKVSFGSGPIYYVNNAKEAASYLETKSGKIFLTTGSKELPLFTETISDRSRLFARVLPSAEVIASCKALGLEGRQICGMQGPFSMEMNRAMLQQWNASYLVTKDTGSSGGYPEKLEAAASLGVQAVVIRRPEETGDDWETLKKKLDDAITRWNAEPSQTVQTSPAAPKAADTPVFPDLQASTDSLTVQASQTPPGVSGRQISCVGIGMGTPDTLTCEAAKVIRSADLLFGSKRVLESARQILTTASVPMVEEYSGAKIAAYLDQHPGVWNIVILMSGDVGFYSGARGIEQAFPGEQVRYYCGISSVVYFASKIPTAWQDAKLVSAHGKELALLNYVNRYPKLILLVSGREDVERLCTCLCEADMHEVKVTVGANLSYPEETIRRGAPDEFLHLETTGLHIMMIEHPAACHILTPGLPDEAFIRGKVPMTKEEIRILSVAHLQLTEDAVVYDIGAGTGSVSVEIARLCTAGRVYAVERNPEGIALILENSRKFRLSNLISVEGSAPEALAGLPTPTHAFLGGSSGNMRQIIQALLEKNPRIRIVINTVTLESISEVMGILKELDRKDAEIIQVSAARAKTMGRYHLMMGQNPVYLISFGGQSAEAERNFEIGL